MPTQRRWAGIDLLPSVLAAASLALLAFGVWVLTTHLAYSNPRNAATTQIVFTSSWLLVGLVAIRLGRSVLAVRILTLSTLLAAAIPGGQQLLGGSWLARLLETVSTALTPLPLAAAAHLMMSFPSGQLRSRTSRRVLAAAYAVAMCEGAWWS